MITVSFLGWMTIINLFILSLWFFIICFYKETVYNLHSQWIPITQEQFNVIHYAGMAFYKILILLFFFTPYLVLKFSLS